MDIIRMEGRIALGKVNLRNKKYFSAIAIVFSAIALLIIFPASKGGDFKSINNFEGEINLYKSLSCRCCDVYGDYFKSKGNININLILLDEANPSEIKDRYEIPPELRSCHTTIIRGYFVEGHIPLEAVEKLLKENPNIKGIAMPGMPSGSPGMPGTKQEDFIIYAVNHDGSYGEFMRI